MNVFLKSEIADNYDAYYQTEVGKKVNAIEETLIVAALMKIPKGKMLELGCGTGHWTAYFVQNGFEVTATDISDAMLKYARQKESNAKLQKADSEKLPFEKESFDVLSSITMMEFVNDQNRVLDEMYRVLKPNGYLLLGGLNGNSQLGKSAPNDPVFSKANFFTPESLSEKLSRFGQVEVTCGVHFASDFSLTDDTDEMKNHEPVFLLARVQKTK